MMLEVVEVKTQDRRMLADIPVGRICRSEETGDVYLRVGSEILLDCSTGAITPTIRFARSHVFELLPVGTKLIVVT